MLKHSEKVKALKEHLYKPAENYADSFKSDILMHFHEFDEEVLSNEELDFLDTLLTIQDIQNWMDKLTSRIVMKYDEE